MIGVLNKPRLFGANLLQMPFRALGAPLLKQATEALETAANGFDGFARIGVTLTVGSEFHDAEVNAENPFTNRFGRVGFHHHVQVKGSITKT